MCVWGGGGGGGMCVTVCNYVQTVSLVQLKAYQEDFEAEKRDKEKLRDEKQSAAIRHEAEKTSLQLQLDRCMNDLAHFTTEANRLAQQLKLKNEYEEQSFRQHLESKVRYIFIPIILYVYIQCPVCTCTMYIHSFCWGGGEHRSLFNQCREV